MIDWLDVIGATNIVVSIAWGYFSTDLYFRHRMKHQLAHRRQELSEVQRQKNSLADLSRQVREEIDLFNQRTKEEEAKRNARYKADLLYEQAQHQPLAEPHGSVRDYIKGCNCEACVKAVKRNPYFPEDRVYTWGGQLVNVIQHQVTNPAGVLQRTEADVTYTYPQPKTTKSGNELHE